MAGAVCPVEGKVQAVACYPIPETKKELMPFCRNISEVLAPLTDLPYAKVAYEWSPVCQHAFVNSKEDVV